MMNMITLTYTEREMLKELLEEHMVPHIYSNDKGCLLSAKEQELITKLGVDLE